MNKQEIENMRQSLEMQHKLDEMREANRGLKAELKAAIDGNHLMLMRLDNIKAYLTGSGHEAARIESALVQVMQAQGGR